MEDRRQPVGDVLGHSLEAIHQIREDLPGELSAVFVQSAVAEDFFSLSRYDFEILVSDFFLNRSAHSFDRFLIGRIRDFIHESLRVLDADRDGMKLGFLCGNRLVLNRDLFLLLHQDVVLLLQILPATVFRFMIQMQAVLITDIEKHGAAGGIESHFSVVQLAGLLVRIRKIEPQSFEGFFLLRCDLTITVFTIEDMAFMDVRSRFIQMQ